MIPVIHLRTNTTNVSIDSWPVQRYQSSSIYPIDTKYRKQGRPDTGFPEPEEQQKEQYELPGGHSLNAETAEVAEVSYPLRPQRPLR